MRKPLVILVLLLFFLPHPQAVLSGSYTDYTYRTDYLEPSAPETVPLNCTFFYRDGSTCTILEKIGGESRDRVLLGIIRRLYPDENQDWVRFWNTRLPIGKYYEYVQIEDLNISDGDYYSNNSLQNTWIRLIDIYPSVFSEEREFYYVPNQALVLGASNVDFVVPNPNSGEWCKQEYDIQGYEVEQKSIIGGLETKGKIVSFGNALSDGEQKNLSYSLFVNAAYSQKLWNWQNDTVCEGSNCTITQRCELNVSNSTVDAINLSVSVPVRKYSNAFSYENRMAVPKRGFAKGVIDLELPVDFLFYQITIKGQSFN